MPGVVSIIEGAAGEHARRCWELLERELGLQATPPGALPHISYHVSESAYMGEELLPGIERVAAQWQAFDVTSTGLGVFAGEPSVLYMTVTRTAELSRLQHMAWQASEPHAAVPFVYGRPDSWVPHITLAMEGLTPELTAQAVALLLPRTPAMEMAITNLALLDEWTSEQPLVHRWEFAGKVAKK